MSQSVMSRVVNDNDITASFSLTLLHLSFLVPRLKDVGGVRVREMPVN